MSTREMHIDGLTERAEKAEARLRELESEIRMCVPYVLATLPISAQGRMSSVTTSDPNWTAVHLGRALSSRSQLQRLLGKVSVDSGSTETKEKSE